jgi:hypothetical protein
MESLFALSMQKIIKSSGKKQSLAFEKYFVQFYSDNLHPFMNINGITGYPFCYLVWFCRNMHREQEDVYNPMSLKNQVYRKIIRDLMNRYIDFARRSLQLPVLINKMYFNEFFAKVLPDHDFLYR